MIGVSSLISNFIYCQVDSTSMLTPSYPIQTSEIFSLTSQGRAPLKNLFLGGHVPGCPPGSYAHAWNGYSLHLLSLQDTQVEC